MSKKLRAVLLFAVVLGICLLPSCGGGKYSDEEIRTALDELLPKSYELNEIYFGEGLPHTEDEAAVEAFYNSFDTDVSTLSYVPVAADCGYGNETELREATLAVFSDAYAETLFSRAFTGITAVINEGYEQEYVTSAMYARYLEQAGVLTVRINLKEEALPLGRVYDTSTMEIIRQRDNRVTVVLSGYVNGVEDCTAEITLVLEEDGWRLDSPTY